MSISKFIAVLILAGLSVQLATPQNANAGKEYNVFDVRKSLALADDEPVYRDYYINMGSEDGIKVGQKLLVYRKVPVLDMYRNKAQGDLITPVATVQVIHAQNALSIARLVKKVDSRRAPVLQHDAVMVGDRVEMIANETATKEEAEDNKDAKAD